MARQPDTSGQRREQLEKVIPFRSYIALGLGIVVGIGWVIYSGNWLRDGGPLGAMLAFMLGGLMLIPVGKCYGELTAALPVAGGEVAFSYKAFGSFIAFLTGWALAFGYVTVTPFETIAIGALLEAIFPALTTPTLYHVGHSAVRLSTLLPGLMIGVFLIWLNYRGTQSSTRFQTLAIAALFACTAVFTAVALIKGDPANLTPLFSHQGPVWVAAPASIIAVIVVVPWFMSGFDAIPQAAEEAGLKMPPERLGTAIITTIIAGALFYVLIILAVAISMPWHLSSKLALPTAAVFRAAFGYDWAARLVLITALMGLVTTLNGMYIAASRLIFSLGRGGLLPHWFADVHPRHHTPKNAILFVGAVSLAGPFIGKAALAPIVSSSSLGFSAALFITCLSAIRLRHTAPDMARPYRVGAPTLYAGAAVALVLVLLMVLPQSPGQLAGVEFAIIGLWMAVGLPAYAWRQAKKDLSQTARAYLILGEKPP